MKTQNDTSKKQSEILNRFKSLQDVADDIGTPVQTVRTWKHRNRIPASYWQRLINSARRRGIPLKAAELLESAEQEKNRK